jgi:predicted ester cyclase
MKYLVFLLLISCFSVSAQVAENNASKVWVLVNNIKDNAKTEYEKWMTDIFFKPMNNTKDPFLAQQNASTRWLTPAKQNSDKTWTYVFLMDPVIPNANYDIESYLKKTYGEAQGKAYMIQYQNFIATDPQFHVLNNDRVESKLSDKEKVEIASKSVATPMSPTDIAARNKATFIKINAFYNDRKFDEALKFYAPNFVRHSEKSEQGHAGVKARWEATAKMWPDHKGNIENIVAEGDWVMVRGRATATHTELVMGVKPTNKKMEVTFWEAIRFDKDGIAIENWTTLDNFALMQQLGLVPMGK